MRRNKGRITDRQIQASKLSWVMFEEHRKKNKGKPNWQEWFPVQNRINRMTEKQLLSEQKKYPRIDWKKIKW